MTASSLRVPPAFVITAAALDAHVVGARSEIERIASAVPLSDPAALQAASSRIGRIVRESPLSPGFAAELHAARARWLPGDAPIIVRSSGVGEDGADASFAGQLDSFAGVRTPAELEQAVLGCWASAWSARALFYARARGRPLRGVGVVVQALVDARISGVLFTVAPGETSGTPATMLGEFRRGPGEALVSGRVTPGAFRVSRAAPFLGAIVSRPEGDVEVALDAARLRELGALGTRLEAIFGGPQDIEWCIDDAGDLFVVQSRPITAQLPSSPSAAAEPVAPVRFSNANVNENFPSPISPLLYSIARRGYAHYFRALAGELGIAPARVQSVEPALEHIVGVHGARLYYNLTNLHSCLRAAPFGEQLTSYFNVFVGVSGGAAEGSSRWRRTSGASTAASSGRGLFELAREIKETARALACATRAFATVGERLRVFERDVDLFAARAQPGSLADKTDVELEDLVRAFLAIRCDRWAPAALSDAAAMLSYGALRSALARALPGSEHSALQNNLLTGLTGIVSSAPSLRLWELSRLRQKGAAGAAAFDAAFEDFVEQHGFRCSGELMLTTPSFQEDRPSLMRLVDQFAAVDGASPLDALGAQAESRRRHVAQLMEQLSSRPALRLAIKALLDLTQRSIGLRERARLKQALLYSRLRRVALEIGQRFFAKGALASRDDVFMLTIDELLEHMAGGAMFPDGLCALAALRRAQHEALSAADAPADSFVVERGSYAHEPAGRSSRRPAVARAGDAGDGVGAFDLLLLGTPACGGVVEGRAAVLKDVTEAHKLARGDVLVTRQTDPGWGPVLFLAGALVMERGGMLSHGAIIAREFGVPCVVGVPDAVARIPLGARVVVDGDAGQVRVADIGEARSPAPRDGVGEANCFPGRVADIGEARSPAPRDGVGEANCFPGRVADIGEARSPAPSSAPSSGDEGRPC